MKIFRLKFLLLFFALALALPPAWAQNEVTVCDGTSGTSYLPVYGYNFDYSQHNQMIYPVSELSELPTGCFITSITFYPTSAIVFKGADVTFSMANLEGAAPFEVDGYGYSSPLDVAVTTVGTMTPAGQTILTIELAEPFQYDGGDLLIDVTTPGKTYGDNTFYSKQLSDYYGFYSYGSTEKATNYLPKLTIAYTAESRPYAASVNPKSIDFGKVAPNTSYTQNVTIKNIGENAITPTVSGLDAPFSATNIPASIAAGESATITIEFNPTTADSFNSTLHIGAQESEDIDLNVTLAGQAAYEMTVCDGTTTNGYLPVYGLYVDEYEQNTQMIYPAEMLQSINGKAITSLTFYPSSGINFGTTVTFSLKNLDANTPEYASTPVPIEGYTAVKTVVVQKNSSLTEWTITFDQPFVYSGGDLLLNVETIVGSYGTTYFYGANQTTNQSYYASGKTTKTRSKFLPKVTIGFEDTDEPPIVNVDAPVFNPEDGTTFEENLTVTLTCATAGATIQYSNNGEYFTDYTAPIVIDETTTLYAKAVLGDAESQVVSATYTKEVAPQPFEPMTFVKVNAADQLVAGKKYIIVCGSKALGVAPTGSFLSAIDVTAGDEVTITDNTVAIMTLGGTLNHYTLALGDNYLYATSSATGLSFGNATEWAISDYNGTLAGYRVKHADGNRAVRYQSGNNRFGNYSTTDQNSEYGWIYVEKEEVTPQPEQVATPTFDPEEGTYTAAQNVTITCETEGATIHYTTDGTEPTAESPVYSEAIAVGETMTIKAIAMKEGMTNSEVASATYTINIPQVATPTFNPAQGEYTEAQNVTIACETEGATIHYTTDGTEPTAESPVYSEAIAVGETMTIKAIAMKADMTDSEVASATYTINLPAPEPVATPTFSLVSGSYTGVQTLNLNCETEGATISYSTDGGDTWTVGSTVTVDQDMTIIIKAEKNGVTSETATAYFIIDIPAELPTITPLDGYYSIKNLGNNQYANIAGRKTLNFTNDIDTKAGTVIRVKTNEHGQVEVLRSQAADLQGYANRAMKYVPEIVQLIADKLNAEGDGALLGDEGLDEIMEKFNESFDYHLYVEEAEGGYRLYGKTPSMQPVVDFYREHTHQVETKLPMLEGFINDAIQKLLEKTGGSGESILQPFSLHETWSRMGGTLTEPVDDASTMAFYREVLNNKNYVWSFAYETAMTYWERVKAHDKYEELKEQLGEFAEYIEKIEYVRPETKYYVVQKDGKPDYISEDNKDIINNNGRTIWTVEPREKFVVNFPEENLVSGKYAITLYTDFAYDLPEGVTAYKVTRLTNLGDAQLTALSGTVPAQTPVILKAEVAGNQELALNTNDGTAPTDNLLVGADYFIKEYGINTPQVEKLFGFAKYIFGENFYNNNVAKYEHLMLKTAGTVNNKYMWGLSAGDLDSCTYDLDGSQDCVVRTLSTGEKGLGFYSIWSAPANQAFLVSQEFNPIRLGLRGDVNRDGSVKIDDASAIIDILLDGPENMSFDPQYDYDAADFDEDGRIFVKDVSELIDYLLHNNLRKK